MSRSPVRRNTKQRQVILEELRELDSHPTAAELYALTRRKLPNISLGTVYRNLDVLCRSGLVRKIKGAGSTVRFDWDTRPHHHVRCIGCGSIGNVTESPGDFMDSGNIKIEGYEIVDYYLEFTGYCPECRQN